jgi:hypothetical protein
MYDDSSRPSRVLGSILFVFGLVSCLCYVNMLRPDPLADVKVGHATGTIIAITPSSDFLRRGNTHRYRFIAGDDPYQGTFFRRRDWMGHYDVGKTVDVEYRQDQPGINRLKGHLPPDRMLTMIWVLIMAAVALYGLYTFYTGRDAVRDWRGY